MEDVNTCDEGISRKLAMFLRWPDDWNASPLFWCCHQMYFVSGSISHLAFISI